MSSAHRPTWDPAKGRADDRHKSARVGARQMPSHTKLKFRQPSQQVGEGSSSSTNAKVRRDLKRELEEAERASRNKKRKEQGLALEEERAIKDDEVDETDAERRKLIAHLQELDADEESDEEAQGKHAESQAERKTNKSDADSDSNSDDSSDSEDEDEEDDTAALLRELEKIKKERAEEKERQERERSEMEQSSREEEIALGNPLLNLENALRGDSSSSNQAESTGFGVKRRWDDDVIFKNQAAGNEGDKSGFVNDLTRSEFHKRFMQRYVR